MDKEAIGTRTEFTDGGKLKRKMWIHRTLLPNLKFDTKYGKIYKLSVIFFSIFRPIPARRNEIFNFSFPCPGN